MSYFAQIRTQETEEGARRRRRDIDQSARPLDGHDQRRLSTVHDQGVKVLWGADLRRAIEQSKSHVQIGQTVAARIVSTEPLESRSHSSRSHSSKSNSPAFSAYRNVWEVETPRYLEQSQQFARRVNASYRGASQEGINDAEGLALYLIHDGAERLAKVRYSNPEDQAKFLNRLRDVLNVPNEREAVIKAVVERIKLRSRAAFAQNTSARTQPGRQDPNRAPASPLSPTSGPTPALTPPSGLGPSPPPNPTPAPTPGLTPDRREPLTRE